MLLDDKRQALLRTLAGGMLGLVCWLLVSWLTQPGSFLGGSLGFDFTFYYGNLLPEALGGAISGVLWFCFGAGVGVATLPFAGEGKALLLRSLAHFGVMALTVALWAFLNFHNRDYPLVFLRYDLLYFLVPFALIYLLVWLGRWVGWMAEADQLRAKLGLTAGPSPLKWRETLPHAAFAALLCLVLPLVLRLCDAPDVPVLSGILYPGLLLPIGSFCSAFSLGRRQGFCPLYPASCVGFTVLFILLFSNMADGSLVWIALLFPLAGNALGALLRRERSAS